MATFKVGQRVRKVRLSLCTVVPDVIPLEAEGVIVRIDAGPTWPYWIDYAGHGVAVADADMLAPLTDPKAEQFIESIKRLKPYDEPKVTEREREWDRAMGVKP